MKKLFNQVNTQCRLQLEEKINVNIRECTFSNTDHKTFIQLLENIFDPVNDVVIKHVRSQVYRKNENIDVSNTA